jgi:hypothetical protein
MRIAALVVFCGVMGTALGQEAPSVSKPPPAAPAHVEEGAPQQAAPGEPMVPPPAPYDASIFLKPMAAAELEFVKQFDGAQSGDLYKDKRFKNLMKQFVPDCEFHYGRDMPLRDALDAVLKDSKVPVVIRGERYVTVSGLGGTYLGGRGFLWLDLQAGIGLGGFYFHPTNGEPTPVLVVFSRHVKEETMSYGELPQDFVMDMGAWSMASRVPFLLTNYFITGKNRRELLEHDEDYCAPGAPQGGDCGQMNADAADLDMTAAYYLDQVHYATNGTAWMIGPDQQNFLVVRDRTCGGIADPMGCRIRMTRERVHVIQGRPAPVHRH